MKTLTDIFLEKSSHLYWDRKKVQVYKDNPENRRLHRVGMPYTRGKDVSDGFEGDHVEERTYHSIKRPPAGTLKRIDDSSKFGKNYTGYKDAPRSAIVKLFEERSGQVEAAFNVYLPVMEAEVYTTKDGEERIHLRLGKGKGGKYKMMRYPVDLVWGYTEGNGDDLGLLHNSRRHYLEQSDYNHPSEMADAIIEAMGEIGTLNHNRRFRVKGNKISFVSSKGILVVLRVELNRDSLGREMFRLFVQTSYNSKMGRDSKQINQSSKEAVRRKIVLDTFHRKSGVTKLR